MNDALKVFVVRGTHIEMGVCVIAARTEEEAIELFDCPNAVVVPKRLEAKEILWGHGAAAYGVPRILWAPEEYKR